MNGQWSLLLAAEAAVSGSGQAGRGSRFFSANLKSALPAPKMLLGDFLQEKLGSFRKEFRGTKLRTGKLWGGEGRYNLSPEMIKLFVPQRIR